MVDNWGGVAFIYIGLQIYICTCSCMYVYICSYLCICRLAYVPGLLLAGLVETAVVVCAC